MTAEAYLEQIKKLAAIIENKKEEYTRWVGLASGGGDLSAVERVKASKNPRQIPQAIVQYVELEREIRELMRQRDAIIATIERLPAIEYQILYRLYVKDCTLKEIAYQFHKSYAWAKKKKKNALRLVQSLVDKAEG